MEFSYRLDGCDARRRPADWAGGDARDDRARLDIAGHHAPCADEGSFADGDATQYRGVAADRSTFLDRRRHDHPIRIGLEAAIGICRPRIFVVDEHHAVADENLVFDYNALKHERVTRYLYTATEA